MSEQSRGKYDSAFCGNLPIHLINIVQPYGVLIVIDKESLNIIQASENIDRLLGKAVQDVIDTPITNYVDGKAVDTLRQRGPENIKDKIPVLWEIQGKKYLGLTHVKEDYYIIEINLDSTAEVDNDSFINVYQDLRYAMATIDAAKSIREAAEIAAKQLKLASGFDKVMIYQFDEDWNGHVLAEEKEADMETYYDFTFPASDIPKQARDLYSRNTYRFIPDRSYVPVKLYPVMNPATHSFIDLSECNVRGVSAVHIEYLRNMQVEASMSTRIMKEDKLWGLIACHHKTAKQMNFKICSIFELMSGIISSKITSLVHSEKHILDNRLQEQYTEIIEDVYRSSAFTKSLLKENQNVLSLFNATGAVIKYNGNIITSGSVPRKEEIEDILLWLHAKQVRHVHHTDRFGHDYDTATTYKENASGLLVIPINTLRDEYVLLFRPEVIQEIKWGGDPSTRINFEADMKTYHPRFSFKLWQEQVKGVSIPWKQEEIRTAENLRSFLFEHLHEKNSNN